MYLVGRYVAAAAAAAATAAAAAAAAATAGASTDPRTLHAVGCFIVFFFLSETACASLGTYRYEQANGSKAGETLLGKEKKRLIDCFGLSSRALTSDPVAACRAIKQGRPSARQSWGDGGSGGYSGAEGETGSLTEGR